MITITSNVIEMKQGESGTIRFYFKDKKTDYPYIIQKKLKEEDQIGILFIVRDGTSSESKEVIRRFYDVDTDEPGTDWHQFKNIEIKELPQQEDREANVLYFKQETDHGKIFVYGVTDGWYDGDEIEYSYEDSSLLITFSSEDTKNLPYKNYYYEIALVEGVGIGSNNEDIFYKNTLIESSMLNLTGALII